MKRSFRVLCAAVAVFAFVTTTAAGEGRLSRQERKALWTAKFESVMDSIIRTDNFHFVLSNNVRYQGFYRNPYINVYPDRLYVKVYENTPADYAFYKVIRREKINGKWFYEFEFTGNRNQDVSIIMKIDPKTGHVDYVIKNRKTMIGSPIPRIGYIQTH